MNIQSLAFNSLNYGIYKRIKGTIYFTEFFICIETTMDQNSRMVDLLIQEKQQALDIAVTVYIPVQKSQDKNTVNIIKEKYLNRKIKEG